MKGSSEIDPKVEHGTNLRIITFTGNEERTGLDSMLGRELERQTEDLEGCHLLLDFTKVAFINDAELGTLIRLHKRIRCAGGRLTLFNLGPLVFEVFEVTGLLEVLEICRED